METTIFGVRRMVGRYLLFLLMLNLHSTIFPYPTTLTFERLTVEDGISQNTIKCILQDKRGFLWLGTEGGLNRYDGHSFKIYSHEHEKKDSLSNDSVEVLFEDSQGVLWVGTKDGLNRFDRLKETFFPFVNDPEDPTSLSHDSILSIYEDKQGILWVGTDGGGLNKFDPQTGTFSHYLPMDCVQETRHAELSNTFKVYAMYQDRGSQFWLGTQCGLYRFNPKTGDFTWIKLDVPMETQENTVVRVITGGAGGILWLGTGGGGVIRFNPVGNMVRYYQKGPENKTTGLSCNHISSLWMDRYNPETLWVGTYGGGLNRFDIGEERFVRYLKRAGIPDSLSNDKVYSLYMDRSGILWIGTESGLNKLDERKSEFAHWTVEPGNEHSLKNEFVWSIFKDGNDILWIGTNEGLTEFNRESGAMKHYMPPDTGSNDKRVSAIYGDQQGNIWVGTRGGGVSCFDRQTEKFQLFQHDKNNPDSLSDDFISVIFVDRSGTVWVGTENGGLNRFFSTTGTFASFNWKLEDLTALSSPHVSCIYEDPNGVLWVGTIQGLNRFDRDKKTFRAYKYSNIDDNGLSMDSISSILTDRSGTLWVGTYGGGLNRLVDPVKGIFSHFRKKKEGKSTLFNQVDDGLPSDMINGILEDNEGNLWLSTDKGLSKFNPRNVRCKNYDVRDGLQSNEFTGHACYKAAGDGEMFFGGINGFNAFYPDRIKDNTVPPSVVITDFLVFNEPFLPNCVTEMERITLSYKQSVFAIEFASLDFAIPSKNKYLYKMEGVDPAWVPRDYTKRFAGYTQLAPGQYVFRVKGSNSDGCWGREASLKITITPPFWETWWFRIGLLLFLFLLVLTAHLMRTKLLRLKLAEQKRVQELLKESHDEMERARDLAELRHAENEKLLTSISSVFIAVDCNGLIFQWNKVAVEFFCIPKELALHCPFVEVLKESIASEVLAMIIEKGLSQEQPFTEIEITVDLVAKGNGTKLLLSNISPILDRAGKKLGFLLMAKDITNRKEEELLLNLSKKLEALGQMASGIAHEIKTPLQYIGHNARFVGDSFNDIVNMFNMIRRILPDLEQSNRSDLVVRFKELMKEYDLDYILEEVPKASDQIINGVAKVSEIIQSMTDYSYPGRGFKEKWNLNELLKSALVVLQNSINRKAELRLELFERLPAIPCYPGELSQVFLNLLVNAVDAIEETGEIGTITIATFLENDEVVISIKDTGVGIPESNRNSIFNPFFTTKQVGKGTGQGLSLAHNVIAEKHNGKLEFTSKVGEGTTFYIRLPLEKEGDQ